MKFVQNWESIVIEIRIHGKLNLSNSQLLNFQIAIWANSHFWYYGQKIGLFAETS